MGGRYVRGVAQFFVSGSLRYQCFTKDSLKGVCAIPFHCTL